MYQHMTKEPKTEPQDILKITHRPIGECGG